MVPIAAIAQLAQMGVAAGAQIGAALSPAARQERKEIKKDISNLKQNNFGYSDAQKQQVVAAQLEQIRAQSNAAQDALNRQNAAAGGAQSGAYFKATQDLAKQAEQQSGVAAMNAQQQSDVLAAQQKADALARVTAKADKNKAAAQRFASKSTPQMPAMNLTSASGIVGGSGGASAAAGGK